MCSTVIVGQRFLILALAASRFPLTRAFAATILNNKDMSSSSSTAGDSLVREIEGEKGVDRAWISKGTSGRRVVFFPGDNCLSIADKYPSDQDDILRLSDPSNILRILGEKFSVGGARPDVYLVEPSRVDEGVWACFDNFLEGTKSGEPTRGYVRNGHASSRLAQVLQATSGDADGAVEPPTVCALLPLSLSISQPPSLSCLLLSTVEVLSIIA